MKALKNKIMVIFFAHINANLLKNKIYVNKIDYIKHCVELSVYTSFFNISVQTARLKCQECNTYNTVTLFINLIITFCCDVVPSVFLFFSVVHSSLL